MLSSGLIIFVVSDKR